MVRLLVATSALAWATSATCSRRPDVQPLDQVHLDAGEGDGGEGLDGGSASLAPDCRPCSSWGPVEQMGPLPRELDEISGLAASRRQPGIIYAHNDSGDSARFFALDYYGRMLAELRLPGAEAVDWEDMAMGPCGDADCLFLADMGDNLRRRPSYAVYRVREPDLAGLRQRREAPPELELKFDRLPFEYPNGERHNAEALLSHPLTGDLFIVTKERSGAPGELFRFPLPLTPGQIATLIALGKAPVPTRHDALVTGGDVHPCGDAVLLRMYNRVVELRAAPDAGPAGPLWGEVHDRPTPIDEPQGEAVTWGPDGQSYFTASEHTGQTLHRVRCFREP